MTDKAALRATLTATRRAMDDGQRERARAAIRGNVLSGLAAHGPPVGSRIAAYEALPTEPGSLELLAALHRAGYEVIVPMMRADRDLDWGVWTLTRQARLPLGLAAIGTAALILVPALAVDVTGRRLGRGGGSYDRALPRARADATVAALLFEGETVESVPADDWDVPVTAAVTPSGWRSLGPADKR